MGVACAEASRLSTVKPKKIGGFIDQGATNKHFLVKIGATLIFLNHPYIYHR